MRPVLLANDVMVFKRKTSWIMLTVAFLTSTMMSLASFKPASAQNVSQDNFTYDCIPAIKIVADLGYCFGFTLSYFEALENTQILTQIREQNIEDSISNAHQQCYATDFSNQKQLGSMAFSSYVNLSDDSLLRRSAADCRVLMEYYSSQLQD